MCHHDPFCSLLNMILYPHLLTTHCLLPPQIRNAFHFLGLALFFSFGKLKPRFPKRACLICSQSSRAKYKMHLGTLLSFSLFFLCF